MELLDKFLDREFVPDAKRDVIAQFLKRNPDSFRAILAGVASPSALNYLWEQKPELFDVVCEAVIADISESWDEGFCAQVQQITHCSEDNWQRLLTLQQYKWSAEQQTYLPRFVLDKHFPPCFKSLRTMRAVYAGLKASANFTSNWDGSKVRKDFHC